LPLVQEPPRTWLFSPFFPVLFPPLGKGWDYARRQSPGLTGQVLISFFLLPSCRIQAPDANLTLRAWFLECLFFSYTAIRLAPLFQVPQVSSFPLLAALRLRQFQRENVSVSARPGQVCFVFPFTSSYNEKECLNHSWSSLFPAVSSPSRGCETLLEWSPPAQDDFSLPSSFCCPRQRRLQE